MSAYINKASTLAQLERHKEALETYNIALKYQPQNKYILYGKAVTLGKLGKQKEAGEIYTQLWDDKTIAEYKKEMEQNQKKKSSSNPPPANAPAK